MTLVAGIDLSGRSKGRTALAWLEGEQRPRLMAIPVDKGLRGADGDRDLVLRIVGRRPDVVAIDAPLALPHAVTCSDPECAFCFPRDGGTPSYGSRQLEGDGWRGLMPGVRGPMPTVMIAAIAFRGIYLKRRLERAGFRVVETWPMAVYRVLERIGARPASQTLDTADRRALLQPVVDGVEQVAPTDAARDQIDAVAAAYGAWCVATGTAVPLQSEAHPEEGEIWAPRIR